MPFRSAIAKLFVDAPATALKYTRRNIPSPASLATAAPVSRLFLNGEPASKVGTTNAANTKTKKGRTHDHSH